MKMKKLVLFIAAAVTLGAVALTGYRVHQTRTYEGEIAALRSAEVVSLGRLNALEREIEASRRQQEEALATSQKLRELGASLDAVATPSIDGEDGGTISAQQLEQRYEQGRALEDEGQLEEALERYLFCCRVTRDLRWMDPKAKVRAWAFARMARISETLPTARVALDGIREATVEQFLASGPDDPYFMTRSMDLMNIDGNLKQKEKSLALFDQLPADSEHRRRIGISVTSQLTEAQRYREVAALKSPQQMSFSLEGNIGRREQREEDAENATSSRSWAQLSAEDIEVLAAVGETEAALEMIARILEVDASPETVSLLESRLARVGKADLVAVFTKDN